MLCATARRIAAPLPLLLSAACSGSPAAPAPATQHRAAPDPAPHDRTCGNGPRNRSRTLALPDAENRGCDPDTRVCAITSAAHHFLWIENAHHAVIEYESPEWPHTPPPLPYLDGECFVSIAPWDAFRARELGTSAWRSFGHWPP